MDLQPSRSSLIWRVVVPSFVSQNLAFGVSQGSFGPLLQSNSDHFGVAVTTMVLCISALNLSLGLGAPIVSGFMDRIPARRIMIAGALLSAVGYYGLYASNAFPVAVAMYFLLGIGCAVLGVLAPLALVNRWLPGARGRILGLVNTPVALLLVPLLIGEFIEPLGRGGLFLAAAVLMLAAVPLFMMVPDEHRSTAEAPETQSPGSIPKGDLRAVLRSGSFWTIAIAIGVLAGMSSAFIVNVVAFGTDRGLSFAAAASLVSVFAASGAVGSIVLGWLCDRLGALPTVALSAFCQAALCIVLVFAGAPHTYPLVAAMGVFSAPILTLMGAAVSQTIAVHLVNRAIGAVYFVKLPFIFAFAPLFELFSHVGPRFSLSFCLMAVALGLTALALLVLYWRGDRRTGLPDQALETA
jgi:predicted MFS family arabinose efflux permease